MIDISFSELALIGVVALIVIGPERLPKVARTAGHMIGRLQRYVNDVKADINREIELDELRKLQAEMKDAARNMEQSVTSAAREVESSMQQSQRAIESGLRELDEIGHAKAAPQAPDAAASTATAPAPTQAALPGLDADPLAPAQSQPSKT
jgi:sec-independent protein translocase protein TatB